MPGSGVCLVEHSIERCAAIVCSTVRAKVRRKSPTSAQPRTMMPKWSMSVNQSRTMRGVHAHRLIDGPSARGANACATGALIGKYGALQKNMVYTLPRLTACFS